MNSLIKPRSVKVNSIISFIGILLSRILGFARDMLIGFLFGTSPITDAFNITMKVVFYLANQLSSAFNIGFLSIFIHTREGEGKQQAEKEASQIFSFVATVGILVSLLIFLFAPFVALLYPGIPQETYRYLVLFLRITSISFFLITVSGIIWSIFQAYHIFTIPYIAVLIQNTTIVLVIYFLKNYISLPLSVALGTLLMFLFTLIPLGKVQKISLTIPSRKTILNFLSISSPTLISTGIIYFSVLADQIMASFMPTGSITRLEYANKIASLPSAMFGIAIAGAFFPRLSEFVSRNQYDDFKSMLEKGISAIWFLTIPSAAGLILLAAHIIHLLFYFPGGKFTLSDVKLTGSAMAMYAIGIPFQSAIIAFNRGHYAFKDTLTPLKTSTITLITNVILNYILGIVLKMGITGLALGTSLSSMLNFYLLGESIDRKIHANVIKSLTKDFVRIVTYTLPMGGLLYATMKYLPTLHKLTTLALIGEGVIVYGITVLVLKPEELYALFRKKRV